MTREMTSAMSNSSSAGRKKSERCRRTVYVRNVVVVGRNVDTTLIYLYLAPLFRL
ncbi:hypothetical protein K504DRAFT_270298 [Pleomassaria siparia CBS 279.74]|uniref:Uncharacterized protein n=1 Tax=Pleomassaria siparia CBS 279.74 TaxID=1314801 RepID=A0A6G1K8L9_9PLEO|nr:hypothetical protein K504DRAFT_270298 [Pleomassaria siparia CBS 279.74]